MTLTQRKSS